MVKPVKGAATANLTFNGEAITPKSLRNCCQANCQNNVKHLKKYSQLGGQNHLTFDCDDNKYEDDDNSDDDNIDDDKDDDDVDNSDGGSRFGLLGSV